VKTGKTRLRRPPYIRAPIQLSLEEIDDERLYLEHKCFICLEVIADWHGARWQVTSGHHLRLHTGCIRRIQLKYHDHFHRPLRELLPLLRGMRPDSVVGADS
jgi:hypothetical protein